ncbi:hypothetical protein ACWED2_08165 [Amycolatopsis sp. NPDC005003]
MPIPVQEIVEATVARRSGPLRTRTRKPSRRRLCRGGRFGRNHATGIAAATKPTATTSPVGPPRSPARPGPASAAAVNVMASKRLARGNAGPATAGSCAVQPPAMAGLSRPATTATATTASGGKCPKVALTSAIPPAYPPRATASSRPGVALRSSRAPNTGPPAAAAAVSPASSAAPACGPAVIPSSSSAGPDSSSPVRARVAPAR